MNPNCECEDNLPVGQHYIHCKYHTPPPNAERPGGRYPSKEEIGNLLLSLDKYARSQSAFEFGLPSWEEALPAQREIVRDWLASLEPKPASAASVGGDGSKGWVPWKREWVGSFDRGWHIVEAKHLSHNNRVAFLGEAMESGVDALIAAHNAIGPVECREGCPPLTVCDTCQGCPAAPTHPESVSAEPSCSTHPDAPHGFDRNASHNANRYVCECEGWAPEAAVSVGVTPDDLREALRLSGLYFAEGLTVKHIREGIEFMAQHLTDSARLRASGQEGAV